MLEFTLFGPFEAQRDGVTLEGLQSRKANRLLALLTLERNRRVARSWIEIALDISYDALRQAESALRACLGEEKGRIRVESNSLYLDTRGIRIDVFEFERLIEKGDPASLRQCLNLYRGGLLKDWDDSWVLARREEYQESYLEALQTLTRAAVKEQEYDRAGSYLRRFLLIYPEMDSIWGQLIEVYRLGGNSGQAEAAYERYVADIEVRSATQKRVVTPSPRVAEALRTPHVSLAAPRPAPDLASARFEPVGGAVPLDSPFYLRREPDDLAARALQPRTSFVLIKGARQIGKTSLLARLLQLGRQKQATVLRTDWQNIPQAALESPQAFLLNVAETIADQLNLAGAPRDCFDPARPATRNFERFLLRQVFPAVEGWLVWGIDEADRLFECPFKDDIFGMLRSWHNERSLDPGAEWERLTVLLCYATEAYLISNLNQSPFNVGFPVELSDFTVEQVRELNRRYGNPVGTERELHLLYELVGGHPFLVRRSLQEMVLRRWGVAEVEARAQTDAGLFRDHLERLRLMLLRDPEPAEALRTWLRDGAAPPRELFTRLCAAGVMAGPSPDEMRARCRLYAQYLRKALL